MEPWGALRTIVLALVLAAPVGLGGDWIDNDAGHSGDAAPVLPLARAVEPGTFQGRLRTPHDITDVYTFQATAGHVIRISMTGDPDLYVRVTLDDERPEWMASGGSLFASASPRRDEMALLPFDGPWYLVVDTRSNVLHPQVQPYQISFTLEPAASWAVASGNNVWHALELRADDPSRVTVRRSAESAVDQEAHTQLLLLEHDHDQGYASYMFEARGGAPASNPAVDVDTGRSLFIKHQGSHWDEFEGNLRLVAYQSDPNTRQILSAFSLDPADMAAASGDDGVFRRVAATPQEGDALGSSDVNVSVSGRSIGVFHAWGDDALVQHPDGTTTALDSENRCVIVRDMAPGVWAFEVANNMPPNAWTREWVTGLQVPSLGVVPMHLEPRPNLTPSITPNACT